MIEYKVERQTMRSINGYDHLLSSPDHLLSNYTNNLQLLNFNEITILNLTIYQFSFTYFLPLNHSIIITIKTHSPAGNSMEYLILLCFTLYEILNRLIVIIHTTLTRPQITFTADKRFKSLKRNYNII